MRSFREIDDDMVQGHTFSNMSEFEHWAVPWCNRCRHEDGCPIVDAAFLSPGYRPAEWTPITGGGEPFRCTAFDRSAS